MSAESAPAWKAAFARVLRRESLDAAEAESAMREIMAGLVPEGAIAGYLVALRMKGETAEEVMGSARAMRAASTRIRPRRSPLLDTCGTGGDESGTLNLSTAAALVAAAAGAAVAKHGNRSVSSRCGSADVLQELGIAVEAEPESVERSVERHGFGFLFSPRFHPAMRHAHHLQSLGSHDESRRRRPAGDGGVRLGSAGARRGSARSFGNGARVRVAFRGRHR